ncbi:MAG: DUF366 family protein [Candidatus Heimdallarchaeaceae archaeon]
MKVNKKSNYTIIFEEFSKQIIYDGMQISAHYVAQKYNIIGNSILIFRGPMRLTKKEMLDLKDIIREGHLNDVLISSNDSLHIIIEEFDLQPPNIEIEYYRLRLLTQLVIEELVKKKITVVRKGSDIYCGNKKLNVGIATIGLSSAKIHFGLNIKNTGFPSHVNATGLLEIGFKEEEIRDWILKIVEKYIDEVNAVKEDIVKTRPI